MLTRKVQIELTHSERIGNINDAAYLSSSKPVVATKVAEETKAVTKAAVPLIDKKYDWYQNASHIFISFKVSTPDVSQKANVTIKETEITIECEGLAEPIKIELTNPIVPDQSSKAATPKKIELKLKKTQENFNWMGIEKGGEVKLLATAVNSAQLSQPALPSYPSSNQKKKDWSEIDKDIKKEEATEKPEGDSALNALFKQIYERADENTRRAMVKSYQTSGGTVLSTNWEEVVAKDYEGADRPDAPDGQQWAKDK